MENYLKINAFKTPALVPVTQKMRFVSSKPTDDARCQEFAHAIGAVSNMVKMCVGIGNNAAWSACLDAYDHIKKHPRYRQQVKGGSTPEQNFKRFFDILKRYERQLRYTEHNRFFRVSDMSPETRKRYGDITDEQYYDFWAAMGSTAYAETQPFFTSLVNKLRLAYLNHGVANPDIMGWAMAAQMALTMAVNIYTCALDNAAKDMPVLSRKQYAQIFRDFDLSQAEKWWVSCVEELDPTPVELTSLEQKNIELGYMQLEKMWLDENTIFGSRIKTFEEYDEVWRTKGEMKKAIRQYSEMRDNVTEAKAKDR